MKISKNKKGKYEEARRYGECTGRITNGWPLKQKNDSKD